jgi:hypothetical protein
MIIDDVIVLDAEFNRLFERAQSIKATVDRQAKVMDHPIETGAVITDHRVMLPVTVELSLILSGEDYKNTYHLIKALYLSADLLTVQTRVDVYYNMIVAKMPHEETPDLRDGVTLALSLREVELAKAAYGKAPPATPAKAKDAKNTNRGQQQPKETTETRRTSVLGGLFK